MCVSVSLSLSVFHSGGRTSSAAQRDDFDSHPGIIALPSARVTWTATGLAVKFLSMLAFQYTDALSRETQAHEARRTIV